MTAATGAAQAETAGHKPDWELVCGLLPVEVAVSAASVSPAACGLTAQEQFAWILVVDI